MALEFYVEQADRSPQSGIANEEIYAGELTHDDGDGVNVLTFAAADGDGHTGLARYDAQAFAREHEDEVREDKYVPSDEQRNRVQYQPLEDSAIVKVRTPEDNGTDPAPTIEHRDVVGIIDAAGGTAASAGEFQGRIVQEGYTDDAATAYDRGGGNFQAVGVAYRPNGMHDPVESQDFDDTVRVILYSELKDA